MNEQFATDKDRKSNKESSVHFNVTEKRESARAGRRGEDREQQKGQPYEKCDDDDSEPQKL
jgi:hypothetical protein